MLRRAPVCLGHQKPEVKGKSLDDYLLIEAEAKEARKKQRDKIETAKKKLLLFQKCCLL